MPSYDKSVSGIQLVHSKLILKIQERGFYPRPLFGHLKECLVSVYQDRGELVYLVTTYDKHGRITSYIYNDAGRIDFQDFYLTISEWKSTGFGWQARERGIKFEDD